MFGLVALIVFVVVPLRCIHVGAWRCVCSDVLSGWSYVVFSPCVCCICFIGLSFGLISAAKRLQGLVLAAGLLSRLCGMSLQRVE